MDKSEDLKDLIQVSADMFTSKFYPATYGDTAYIILTKSDDGKAKIVSDGDFSNFPKELRQKVPSALDVYGFCQCSLDADQFWNEGLSEEFLSKTAVPDNHVERIFKPNAEDFLWFGFQKGEERFRIALSDILMCLRFAEKNGEVPELPVLWWTRLSGLYPKLTDGTADLFHISKDE